MKTQDHTHHLFKKLHWAGAAACVLGLLITTGTGALAQSSGKTRPFHAEGQNILTSALPPGEPGIPWTYDVYGKSTDLGKITGSKVAMVLYYAPDEDEGIWYAHGSAVETIVAANGDELIIAYIWSMNVFGPLGPIPTQKQVINATCEFVGGTGRFESATGQGTVVAHPDDVGNLYFVIDGVINY